MNMVYSLGNEDTLVRLDTAAQLRFGQRAKNLHALLRERCNLYDRHDLAIIFVFVRQTYIKKTFFS